ncbi:orotidine-5'-phosphate decarboxylase [Aestuariivirga litoralis]|uniref:Orotidine 5'-phosphate decarboxylase n=1 Tax=Aestuariivirga litoralis TaxID=2650924 RepID=A0A2W2BL03_9HYPH|nr:orotidine-5'-phosphate decarboxylase [Aestuariivirga litoralis]PZF76587.1 orotidine-5'-phosphate decarboxylase [Aestuariivirga litoralis]
MPANPICVAIDTPDLEKAVALAKTLKPHVGWAKIGMEFFYAHGLAGYTRVAETGLPIFLDLKLHDIPNTVASAMKALMKITPTPGIVNLHATGGLDMMKAAADAVDGRAKLIAVTILTSLSDDDIWAAGFETAKNTEAHARSLAELTKRAGLDGVVCSPHDLVGIRHDLGRDFLTVVPGIRPADAAVQDQKRVATPAAALEAGADILVIGRAITGAADPARAAQDILGTLHAG